MKPLSHYLVFFFLLLLLGGLAISVMWMAGVPGAWLRYALLNLGFFFVVTAASFVVFYASFSGKNSALAAVVGSFLGKLLLSAIWVLIIKQLRSLDILPFFIPFAISYLLFTIPEVVILVKIGDTLARHEKRNEDKS